MKIKEFAHQYGVSSDTVHFYIRKNLLSPQKTGQYSFDARNEREMELIMRWKHYGFSLNEILIVVNGLRFLNEYDKHYQGLKRSMLEKRLKELEKDRRLWNGLYKRL